MSDKGKMNQAAISRSRAASVMRKVFTGSCMLAFIGFLAGCAKSTFLGQMTTASYQPSNVYRAEANLSSEIKRVAVLPLTTLNDDSAMEFGREALWPVLVAELGRTRQFELVSVSPDELRLLTGRNSWSGEEKLPIDF